MTRKDLMDTMRHAAQRVAAWPAWKRGEPMMDTVELTGYDNHPIMVCLMDVIGVEQTRDGATIKLRGGGTRTVQESAAYVRSLLPNQGMVTR